MSSAEKLSGEIKMFPSCFTFSKIYIMGEVVESTSLLTYII